MSKKPLTKKRVGHNPAAGRTSVALKLERRARNMGKATPLPTKKETWEPGDKIKNDDQLKIAGAVHRRAVKGSRLLTADTLARNLKLQIEVKEAMAQYLDT